MPDETFSQRILDVVAADAPPIARLIAVARLAVGAEMTHRELWGILRISRSAYFKNLSKLSLPRETMGLPRETMGSPQGDYGSPQRDPGVSPGRPPDAPQSLDVIKRYFVPPDPVVDPPPVSRISRTSASAGVSGFVHELRADWGQECAKANKRIAFVNRSGDGLRQLMNILDDHGWETVREVHRFALRQALAGEIPNSYYTQMLRGGGWAARLEAFESRSRKQLSVVCDDDSPDLKEMLSLFGGNNAG